MTDAGDARYLELFDSPHWTDGGWLGAVHAASGRHRRRGFPARATIEFVAREMCDAIRGGYVRKTVREMAEASTLSPNTVAGVIRFLESHDLLRTVRRRTHGGKSANAYLVIGGIP